MSEVNLRHGERRIVIEQNGAKEEVSENEAYEMANEINKDNDKEAKIVENELVVKDVLKG